MQAWANIKTLSGKRYSEYMSYCIFLPVHPCLAFRLWFSLGIKAVKTKPEGKKKSCFREDIGVNAKSAGNP